MPGHGELFDAETGLAATQRYIEFVEANGRKFPNYFWKMYTVAKNKTIILNQYKKWSCLHVKKSATEFSNCLKILDTSHGIKLEFLLF